MSVSRLAFSVLVLVVLVIGFAIGFLAGYLGRPSWLIGGAGGAQGAEPTPGPCDPGVTMAPGRDRKAPVAAIRELEAQGDTPGGDRDYGGYSHEDNEAMEELGAKLMEELKASNIKTYLRKLVKQPHLTGTVGDLTAATTLRDFFKDQGFDSSKVMPYNVLLSFPDPRSPSHVELYDRRDNLVFTSRYESETGSQNQSEAIQAFSAYSAIGSPKGELVYVNYGTVDDFLWLRNQIDIDVTGRICIARYGKIHISAKTENAETFGAAGLILYTDPPLDTSGGSGEYRPDIEPRPPDGTTSGTLLTTSGDPLTPGYPAIGSAYRLPPHKTDLPRIPVHPIRTDDAQILLNLMRGREAEESWRGRLPITYHYGPGFIQDSTYRKVRIKVSVRNTNATVHNVISVIQGRLEPDRYVLVSSHHDSWTSGSVDSTSGTAVTMELGRAMGKLVKGGWRPRRSIVFCSWAASNYGQLGSTEWIEQFNQLLGERAVGIINIGMAVQGNFTFNAEGTPLAYGIMRDISKHINNPDENEKSIGHSKVYDTWAARQSPSSQPLGDHVKPRILPPDPMTDVAPFLGSIGVTSINVGYISNQVAETGWPMSSCAVCPAKVTLTTLEESIDPNYEFHLAISRYAGELARRLAEHTLLPYDVRDYSTALQSYLAYFMETNQQIMKNRGMGAGLGYLQEAVTTFQTATEQFSQSIGRLNKSDPLVVRMVNDRLMSLERAFVNRLGPPGLPSTSHILYSGHGRSTAEPFPGLSQSLVEARQATLNSSEKWEAVRRQLSILTHFIHEAASVLKPEAAFF